MRVAVLTVSDSVSRGERQDRSGPGVAERCRALGWEVTSCEAVSDDREALEKRLAALADSPSIDAVLTEVVPDDAAAWIAPHATGPDAVHRPADVRGLLRFDAMANTVEDEGDRLAHGAQ